MPSNPQFLPDVALGSAALTSPFWLHLVQSGLEWYVLSLGAVVITLRAILALRDLRNKKEG